MDKLLLADEVGAAFRTINTKGAAPHLYTVAELLPALRHDLLWRKQRLADFVASGRGSEHLLNQLQTSLWVGESVLEWLQRQPYSFQVAGGATRSLDVIGDALTEHLRRADPNISGLDVRIVFGTNGLYPVKLDLILLSE